MKGRTRRSISLMMVMILLVSCAVLLMGKPVYADYFQDAVQIEAGKYYTGVLNENSAKWYKFTLEESSYVKIYQDQGEKITKVSLWYDQSNYFFDSLSSFNDNVGTYTFDRECYLLGGTYYLKVVNYNSKVQNNNIKIHINVRKSGESFPETRYDQYDDTSNARDVETDKDYYGVLYNENTDMYRFVVGVDQKVRVNVKVNIIEPNTGDALKWEILNSGSYTITRSGYFSDDGGYSSRYIETFLEAGTYYVKFYHSNELTSHASTYMFWLTFMGKDDISIKNLKEDYLYTGSAVRPNINVYYKDELLTTSNYNITYYDNIKIGTAWAEINGKGKYKGINKSVSFNIVPAITKHPESITAFNGKLVSFSIAAKGNDLTYQWQYCKDGKTWKNSTAEGSNSTTVVFKANNNNGVKYRCVVKSGSQSSISSEAMLNVKLKVTKQPVASSGYYGDVVKLTTLGEGPNLKYQWQVSSDGKKWANSSAKNSNTRTVSITATKGINGKKYRCKIYCGTAVIYTNAVILTTKSNITSQPNDKTVYQGEKVRFSVTANGNNLKYQWQYSIDGGNSWKNSKASSSTTNSICFTTKKTMNNYRFRCVVKNGTERTISKIVILYVR